MNSCEMEKALHQLMGTDYLNCSGTTYANGYMAYYHGKRLYQVEQRCKAPDVVCLVYAKNPYEAIDLVDKFRQSIVDEIDEVEAIEKQIPKKPYLEEDKMYQCPTCYNNLMFKYLRYPDILMPKEAGGNHCMACGQKIDWSEVE